MAKCLSVNAASPVLDMAVIVNVFANGYALKKKKQISFTGDVFLFDCICTPLTITLSNGLFCMANDDHIPQTGSTTVAAMVFRHAVRQ